MKNRGFTIIEIMVSLMIISIGIIQIVSIISYSIRISERNKTLFHINQKYEYIKNEILSSNFNSLKDGITEKTENEYKISIEVQSVLNDLKKIIITIIKKDINKTYYFYKLKHIN